MLQFLDSAITQASLCYVVFPAIGMAVVAAISWGIDKLTGEAE